MRPLDKRLLSSAILLLGLPPLFWAGNFIVGRAMGENVPPLTLSLLRWAIALFVILPFAWKLLKRDWWFYRANPWLITRLSGAGVVCFTCLTYVGLGKTSATNALLLNSFVPVLIALFGALFYGQQLSRIQIIGLLVSSVGVLAIVSHGTWGNLVTLTYSVGDLIVFCAMASFAFYTLWLRGVPPSVNRIGLMAAQIAVALIALIPLCLIEASRSIAPAWTLASVLALLYLGIFPSVLAYLLFNIGVARFGASKAGLCIHLIPPFGAVLAVVFLGETLYLYHGVGIAGILIGIYLTISSRPTNRVASKERPARAGKK